MRWSSGLVSGVALSVAASAALACSDPRGCERDPAPRPRGEISETRADPPGANPYTEDRYGPGYDEPYAGRSAAACACDDLRLPSSFFDSAGSVGPIPVGAYEAGGVFILNRASEFAPPRRLFRGGFRVGPGGRR